MKLTAIILLVGCLQLSARGLSQNITLSLKDVPLQKVFKEIERQTDYTFFADRQWLLKARKVTIIASGLPLGEVLELCFKDQPFSYSISGKTITLGPKKEKSDKDQKTSAAQDPPIDIKGRVVNANGEPIPDATISIKGSNKTTITNVNGEFAFKGVDEDVVLVISHIQYETTTLLTKGKSLLNATLQLKINSLDELQVIAYGTTTRRFNTGNVASVKSSDIEKHPVNNPLLALQGRVPGIVITQSNGLPGGGVTIRIQGINSINGGNDPLYVIDGVPYTSQMLVTTIGGNRGVLGKSDGGSVYSPGGNGNPMNYINPADIESIEVLKDADATSIYGSRAANGAILITTKKGKAGQTKVDLNIQQGWGKVAKNIEMMNTEQYLEMRKEALKNDGIATPSKTSDYDINGLWDTTRFTDWRKVLIGGVSGFSNLNLKVSGGTTNTNYLVGCTYRRETTVFPGSFSDERGAFHFNLNSTSNNQKFSIQLSNFYLIDNNRLPQLDLTANSYSLAPNAPALYTDEGSLNWAQDAASNSSWMNPLSTNLNIYQNKTKNLISNILLSYKILKGLEIRSSFGYTNLYTTEFAPNNLVSNPPEQRSTATRYSYYSNSTISSWIVEPQINYKKILGKGKFDLLLGTTLQHNNNDGLSLIGLGYNTDDAIRDIRQATTIRGDKSVVSIYKYVALFSRLNYIYNDKYIVDITARRDGSSRFGHANQYHNFGSIGLGWIFSQENFIQKNLSFLSFGKFRGSIGSTGNDQIGDYSFMNLYTPTSGIQVPYQGAGGLTVSGLPNPYLQWEETKKMQLGVDLGFLRDRVLISATFSRNRSTNQLLSYALPIITGNTGILENFPATVQNKTWEFSLNASILKTQNTTWNSSINLTIPDNKLIEFPNLETSTLASRLIIGKPVTIIKAYEFLGVDESTGIYQFSDGNGGTTSRPDTAKAVTQSILINTSPKFYGGFQSSLGYKRFKIDLLFQFVKQIGTSGFASGFSSIPGTFNVNQPVSMANRWQKVNDLTSIQKYNSDSRLINQFNNANASNKYYSDASFIRLKNLTISYELTDKWKKKVYLRNCNLYLQAQNLFTITNFQGLDPEVQNFSLPPLRVLVVGLTVGL